jgi:hypothetical protein
VIGGPEDGQVLGHGIGHGVPGMVDQRIHKDGPRSWRERLDEHDALHPGGIEGGDLPHHQPGVGVPDQHYPPAAGRADRVAHLLHVRAQPHLPHSVGISSRNGVHP